MKIVYNGEMDPRAFKDVLGSVIPALLTERDDVIYLDADLMSCIGTNKWGLTHPRAINVGVAEANMAGVAAGLALAGRYGYTPVLVAAIACAVLAAGAAWRYRTGRGK